MPLVKRRRNGSHVKVFRPQGMRYSVGEGPTFTIAVSSAVGHFFEEFNEIPRRCDTVIEVVGTPGGYHAALYDLVLPLE